MSQNDMKGSFSKEMSLFEKRIFSESTKNVRVGWINKITNNCCQLSINPWNNNIIFNEKYIIPEDISVENGEFVALEVGSLKKIVGDIDRHNLLAKSVENYYLIESVEKRNVPLSRPNIKSNDFLNLLCDGWNDAELDHLHVTLAIQLLSCPKLNDLIGGLGSETVHYDGLKGPVDRLQREIGRALPSCVKKDNDDFEFRIIRSSQENDSLISRLKQQKTNEICYNFAPTIRKLNITQTINFPTMIKNAKVTGTTPSFDLDFYDYLLTAHAYHPIIQPGIDNKIREYMNEFKTDRMAVFNDFNINLDPNSITKVGLALCRLEYKKNLDEEILKKAWNLCSPLYDDYFSYLYNNFDYVELTNGKRKRIKEKENPMEILNKTDLTILHKIECLTEYGKHRILKDDIIESLSNIIPRERVESTFQKLSERGFIFEPNYYEISLIIDKNKDS